MAPRVTAVVAYARNHVIGADGGMPWHLPTDLKHFRDVTTPGTVVMGRTTWDSIPERFRPLPGRRNLVLSRTAGYEAPGAEVFASFDEALAAAAGDDEVFLIGGGRTYADALARTDRVWATEIDAEPEGDTHFPVLDPAEWQVEESLDPVTENGFTFTIRRYERVR
ncbi:MAG: dihydrofolate reductase [Solirubrobacteraceae bacterium]|nr:dihydrofolate reductase [Patulibacter sp.]